eukprot:3747428-Rhodomonas_salina.1
MLVHSLALSESGNALHRFFITNWWNNPRTIHAFPDVTLEMRQSVLTILSKNGHYFKWLFGIVKRYHEQLRVLRNDCKNNHQALGQRFAGGLTRRENENVFGYDGGYWGR